MQSSSRYALHSLTRRVYRRLSGILESGGNEVGRQAYVDLDADELVTKRDGRKLKDILSTTKKLTKAELTAIVRSVIKEIMREEIVNFMNENKFMRETFAEEFGKYVKSRDFEYLVQRILSDDRASVMKTLEDAALTVVLTEQKKKKRPSRRPLTGSGARRISI
jgi:macrodomain Ter protein organizer (MatP/YcbG family)